MYFLGLEISKGEYQYILVMGRARVMMFTATYNNISFILWQSVLLVEEQEYP